jgi:hypothetical protein
VKAPSPLHVAKCRASAWMLGETYAYVFIVELMLGHVHAAFGCTVLLVRHGYRSVVYELPVAIGFPLVDRFVPTPASRASVSSQALWIAGRGTSNARRAILFCESWLSFPHIHVAYLLQVSRSLIPTAAHAPH